MGRPALTEEMIKEVTIRLIRVTQNQILRDGLETVSIRRIGKEAGVNSAIIYKYFRDLDELMLFACVDLFRSYCSDLVEMVGQEDESLEQDYIMIWKLFCQHAFQYPECTMHLFFSKHSNRLSYVIEEYYKLFPDQLSGMSDTLQMMMHASRIYERNLEVLRPVLEGRISEEKLQLINNLTVSYFQMLLSEKIVWGEDVSSSVQTERMLEACRFLTGVV